MGTKKAAKIAARLRDFAPAQFNAQGQADIRARKVARGKKCMRSQVANGQMCRHAECLEVTGRKRPTPADETESQP